MTSIYYCKAEKEHIVIDGTYVIGNPMSFQQFECSGKKVCCEGEIVSVKCSDNGKECELYRALKVPYEERIGTKLNHK
ncbi:MAG: hypothetical protein WC781_01005 [Candidatus Pacearchaeota archaeon]|jgi:hypothetical protein